MKFLSINLLNLIIVSNWNVRSQSSDTYSILNNYDVDQTIGSNWLINKFSVNSRIMCLTECNLNSLCLNLFYNKLSSTCSIYSKQFVSTQLIPTSNSDFYTRNSECSVKHIVNIIIN